MLHLHWIPTEEPTDNFTDTDPAINGPMRTQAGRAVRQWAKPSRTQDRIDRAERNLNAAHGAMFIADRILIIGAMVVAFAMTNEGALYPALWTAGTGLTLRAIAEAWFRMAWRQVRQARSGRKL